MCGACQQSLLLQMYCGGISSPISRAVELGWIPLIELISVWITIHNANQEGDMSFGTPDRVRSGGFPDDKGYALMFTSWGGGRRRIQCMVSSAKRSERELVT